MTFGSIPIPNDYLEANVRFCLDLIFWRKAGVEIQVAATHVVCPHIFLIARGGYEDLESLEL